MHEETKSTGIAIMIMFGLGIVLCLACVITEGISFWPAFIPLIGSVLEMKIGYDAYKEGMKKIKKRKKQ